MKNKYLLLIPLLLISFTFVSANTIELTDCKTSDWIEGETYVLQNNITTSGTCFSVDVNNVTIDLNGHTITGDMTGDGVDFTGNYFTLSNGIITNFIEGVYMEGSSSNNISNLIINNIYDRAIYCSGSYYTNFTNLIISSTFDGFVFDGCDYNTVENIEVSNDTIMGVYIYSSSNNNLKNIKSNGNSNGIYLQENSNYNIFTNTETNNNSVNGVLTDGSSNNNFTDVIANLNVNGIYLASSSNYNSFTNVTANNNSVDLTVIEGNYEDAFINYNFANYTFDLNPSQISFKNSKGKISFYGVSGSGTDLMSDLIINNNYVYVNPNYIGLNVSSNVTFYNMPMNFTNPKIKKNGKICLDCVPYTNLNAGTVVFGVAGWSNYTIKEQQDICGIIPPNNYIIVGGKIIGVDGSLYLDSNVNASYNYTYKKNSQAGGVISDTVTALGGTTTWFPIIIVITAMVVLIFLVVLIVRAVKNTGFTA